MNEKTFNDKVIELVSEIPIGKVTTYGAIAKYCGLKSSARTVGWVLNSQKNNPNLPCHRVVNRLGELTGKNYFGSPDAMKQTLIDEGIQFIGDAVDMKAHFWEPN